MVYRQWCLAALGAVLIVLFTGGTGRAGTTYEVGPGQAYADLAALASAGVLANGDTVVLNGDDASMNHMTFTFTDLTVVSSVAGTQRTISQFQTGTLTERGGIFNFDSSSQSELQISDLIFTGSTVEGFGVGSAQGGVVYGKASLILKDARNVAFINNTADGAGGLGGAANSGLGGAIYANAHISMVGAEDITFSGNVAQGGTSGGGGLGGAVYSSGLDLTNASNIVFSNNEARGGNHTGTGFVSSSGGGGAYYSQAGALVMDGARNILFSDNRAVGGLAAVGQNADLTGLGGAIGLGYDASGSIQHSITGASFINNSATTPTDGDMSSGLGGAIYNSSSWLTLHAEAGGGDIYFSGNTHNPGNTGMVANSIYFGNVGPSDIATAFTVNVDDGALVTMLDPMVSQEDGLVGNSGSVRRNVDLTVDKTGLGTWILAGHNDMQSATTWTVSQGTLYLEALNGAGAHIDLSHDSTASFTVASGASLLVNPADTAHLISARDIEFATGSLVGIGDGGYFSYQDLPNSGQTALLSLRASDSLTNNSTIVNPDGSFVSGFFEYSYYGLEWDVIDGLSEDLVAWIATRSYVPEVGASGATTAPIAIAAQDVVGRTLGNRRRAAFGLLSGCPEVCADLPPECAPEASGLRVWAAGLYEYTDTTGGSYLVRTPGLAVGMELANHQTMFAGLAIIGARPEYRGQHTRVDADTLDAALYGGVLLPGRIEAGAHLAIGRAWYDQKRSVYGEHYAGEYHANTWSAGADLARRFMLDDTWNIRPFAAYRYMGLHGQGYSEHNPGAYALKFDSRTEHLHFVRSGLDLGWLCRERGEIAASAYYAGFYGNTEASVGARFIQDPTGSRHVSQGDKVDRHLFGLGLSGSYRLRDNLDVYGAYNFEMGKETRSHYGNVGLSVGF